MGRDKNEVTETNCGQAMDGAAAGADTMFAAEKDHLKRKKKISGRLEAEINVYLCTILLFYYFTGVANMNARIDKGHS